MCFAPPVLIAQKLINCNYMLPTKNAIQSIKSNGESKIKNINVNGENAIQGSNENITNDKEKVAPVTVSPGVFPRKYIHLSSMARVDAIGKCLLVIRL